MSQPTYLVVPSPTFYLNIDKLKLQPAQHDLLFRLKISCSNGSQANQNGLSQIY